MKLVPKYSFEYNCVLNSKFNETEQVKNFASLIADKDRFFVILKKLESNLKLIEEKLGYKLKKVIEFYVVRTEKFKSFSEPITIEYSILPEEMVMYLIREIVKSSITDRFFDVVQQEQHINSFSEFVAINGDLGDFDLIKFGKNLHDNSKLLNPDYEFCDIDFSKKTMKEVIEELYNNS